MFSTQVRVDSSTEHACCKLLNQIDAQTEDGHAMMKFDTFSLIPGLKPEWQRKHYNNCQTCAIMSQLSAGKSMLMLDKLMRTRHQRASRKRRVDCEGAVRSCV